MPAFPSEAKLLKHIPDLKWVWNAAHSAIAVYVTGIVALRPVLTSGDRR